MGIGLRGRKVGSRDDCLCRRGTNDNFSGLTYMRVIISRTELHWTRLSSRSPAVVLRRDRGYIL